MMICMKIFPLKRHSRDFFRVDKEMPHAFLGPYISPLQHWIDMECVGLCHSLVDSCIDYYAHDVIHYCSHSITYFFSSCVLDHEYLLVLVGDQTQGKRSWHL
jgi:hypothetical protein